MKQIKNIIAALIDLFLFFVAIGYPIFLMFLWASDHAK